MDLPGPFRRLGRSVGDILLLGRTGAIQISSPPEAPLVTTLVLLDGNVVNHIDMARFAATRTAGLDPAAILAGHNADVRHRLSTLSAAAGWTGPVHYLVAGLCPGLPWLLGWWYVDFGTTYLLSAVLPIGAGFALRRTPSFILRGVLWWAQRRMNAKFVASPPGDGGAGKSGGSPRP